MSARHPQSRRRGLAPIPALVLAVTAVLAQSVYAASGAGDCFRPTLETFSSFNAPPLMRTGDADGKLEFKPPFIILASAHSTGYDDLNSGATGSISAAGTSRFWTPTCAGWAYGWSATGFVVGQIKTHAGASSGGNAMAVCSFAGNATGDLNPPAHDSKTAQSSTAGNTSVSVTVGMGPSGPSYGLGMSTGTVSVTPSTNPAGDSNSLFDGPRSNAGPGAETVVVANLYGYVNSQANGSSAWCASHKCQSSSSTAGITGIALDQELYAVSASGIGYGMGVHPQSGFYRTIGRSSRNAPWTKSGRKAPVGHAFVEDGPEEKKVDDPPLPPNPDGRIANDDDTGPDGKPPLHKY